MEKYPKIGFAIFALLFICFLPIVTAADFEGYWVAQTITEGGLKLQTDQENEPPSEDIIYYKNGKMRHEIKQENQVIISRPDLGVFWTIDLATKTYSEMRFEEVKAGIDKAKNVMQSPEMQEAFKNMTPEQREMMEKMMGKKMDDAQPLKLDMKVQRTGKRDKVSGEDCEIVNVLMNSKPFMTLWLTNKYEIGTEFYKMYQRMGLTQDLNVEMWKDLKGFPMKTVVTVEMGGMGKTKSTSTIQKVVKTSVSDDQFELPKGLKKQKMPMMDLMQD